MRRESLYLGDTVEAADHIAEFIEGRDLQAFLRSELLRSGVVQKLAVIGEAAARVSDELRSRHQKVPWPQITAFRNILIHAYFGIDWEVVWREATNRCPVLRKQVAEILASESEHGEDEGGDRPEGPVRVFERYIGIDYSGAQTPESSLPGLRVCMAGASAPPSEVEPPPSARKYWTRRGIAEWLEIQLLDGRPTLVGIDHGFSFPVQYFKQHCLPRDWPAFLEDFQRHWPTHGEHVYVDFVRNGSCGHGALRAGNSHWRRLTELRTRSAKSVFHFDVPGSVAKSTHAGLPWLLYLRRRLAGRIHFWPFDGWRIPSGKPTVAEVYPALWSRGFSQQGRDAHQQDAYAIAAWMRDADGDGSLMTYWSPQLSEEERGQAGIEGWILGVL